MKLNELDQHVLAYFLCGEALQVGINERFYKQHEFVRKFEDQILYSTPDFGGVVSGRPTAVATYLVDLLIKEEGLTTVNDEHSGISHRFNSAKYKAYIRKQIEENEICRRARETGNQFWEQAFAALRKAT